jgi:hypothetical protein
MRLHNILDASGLVTLSKRLVACLVCRNRERVRTEFLHNLTIPAQEEIRQRFQRHSFAFEALE